MAEEYDYSKDVMPAGNNILSAIDSMAHDYIAAEKVVAEKTEDLKVATDKFNHIRTRIFPDAMVQASQKKLTTLSGFDVVMKDVLRASVPDANKPAAFKYLEEHELGAIIKHEMTIDVPAKQEGTLEKIKAIQDLCKEIGLQCTIDRSVHASTLKSNLTALIEEGVDVPLDTFGATIMKEVKVTLPKKK